uniref:Uncharacterized protein n=1 Tax=Moumouvirus sp. 'Monve' TaxID=1128131 RepID=H2EDT1_9VIRU|nr:hypothetical protein mv_L349 [Moumouvirus Monve]
MVQNAEDILIEEDIIEVEVEVCLALLIQEGDQKMIELSLIILEIFMRKNNYIYKYIYLLANVYIYF